MYLCDISISFKLPIASVLVMTISLILLYLSILSTPFAVALLLLFCHSHVFQTFIEFTGLLLCVHVVYTLSSQRSVGSYSFDDDDDVS